MNPFRAIRGPALGAALAIALACSNDPESPTSPTPTTPIAEPSTTELFEDSVPAGGSTFYSFSVQQYGTVNVTLTSIGGPFVPATVTMGLGIGTPGGTDCTTTSTVNTAPGSAVHLTGTYEAGVYCAKIWDVGNLFGTARFTISIAHP